MNTPKGKELSQEQKAAVLTDKPHIRIIAGAGAGKTETLTRRVVYLLLVKKAEPSSIVVFTFTEKAAANIKNRIYERVEQISGIDALSRLGEMFIGTIHGYAKRVLDDYLEFNRAAFDVMDDNTEIAFISRHGFEMDFLALRAPGRTYSDICVDFIRTANMYWDELLNPDDIRKRAPVFFELVSKYEGTLKKHKQITFGLLINTVVRKLQGNPDLLKNVKYLIVDEYQDINRAQAELIRLIGRKSEVFIVGDPRQTIYRWRGSNDGFFEEFTEWFPDVEDFVLKENRRSTKKVIDFANSFASTFSKKYAPLSKVRKEDGLVAFSYKQNPEEEAKWITSGIKKLLDKGAKPSDIGVLFRSVNTSAQNLIDELRSRDIRFIVGGGSGLFRRDETLALGYLFCWFWKDGFWGSGDNEVRGEQLLTGALAFWETATGVHLDAQSSERLRQIKTSLTRKNQAFGNFTELLQKVLIILGYKRLDSENANNAVVMANIGRFNTLLTDYETALRLGGAQPSWSRDLKGFVWFLNLHAVGSYDEQLPDDVRGVNAVQLMTVHQAKGLEWPITFVPCLVKGRFPSRKSENPKEKHWFDIPRSLFDAARYEGSLDDERLLFYVAVTRAKDALILSSFRQMARRFQRSVFLDEVPQELLVEITAIPKIELKTSSMSEEMQSFSAKEVILYLKCPRQYQFKQVWNYPGGLDPHLGYGKSLHHCLRKAAELVQNGLNPQSAIVTAVDEFHLPFMGGSLLEEMRKNAKTRLLKFASKHGEDLKKVEELEYRIEYPLANSTVIGKIDVLMRDNGVLEVRNYKTTDTVASDKESALQVQIYAIGLNKVGRPVEAGSVANLEDCGVTKVPVGHEQLASVEKETSKVLEDIIETCGNWVT